MKRALTALLTANAISMIGSRMSLIAVPWFVLSTTGSATKTGFVAAIEMIPYVLACAFGAPLTDRIGTRRVSIIADALSAVAVAAIPLLHFTSGLSFTGLCVLIGLAGGFRGFGDTSKRVLFRNTVMASTVNVARATSINDGLNRFATLAGAAIAGLLIVATSAPAVIVIDAASFAVCAAIVAAIQLPSATVKEEPYLRALSAGVAFLKQDKLILAGLVMVFCTNLLDAGYSSVLIPVWAGQIAKSPVALGITVAALAGGAVLGNIGFTIIAPKAPRYLTYTIGFLIGGSPRFFAMAFAHNVWTVYLVTFIAGFAIAGLNPILSAVAFERIPEHLQARVQGITAAIAWGAIPVGAILGGWAAESNVRTALAIFGACYLAVTLWPFFSPTWRQMNIPPRVPTQPGEQSPAEAAGLVGA